MIHFHQRRFLLESRRVERRRAERSSCDPQTTCVTIIPEAAGPWPAAILNISATGICLLTECRFQPNSPLVLVLENAGRGFRLEMPARVIHSTIRWPNEAWVHGLAFARALSNEELQSLL